MYTVTVQQILKVTLIVQVAADQQDVPGSVRHLGVWPPPALHREGAEDGRHPLQEQGHQQGLDVAGPRG